MSGEIGIVAFNDVPLKEGEVGPKKVSKAVDIPGAMRSVLFND